MSLRRRWLTLELRLVGGLANTSFRITTGLLGSLFFVFVGVELAHTDYMWVALSQMELFYSFKLFSDVNEAYNAISYPHPRSVSSTILTD